MNEQKRKRMLRIARLLLLAGVCTLAAGQYFS